MNANYPTIYLYGSSDDAQGSDEAKVRIAYGKERKDPRTDDGDWICKIVCLSPACADLLLTLSV